VKPIALFAFDSEFVGLSNIGGVRRDCEGGSLSAISYRLSASYSLTTSICLSSTFPVKRSIATPAAPKPWQRWVHPVMLFPFDDEVVLKTRSIWLEVT
jgi:hypothetical protein